MDDFEKELKLGFLDEAIQAIEEVEQSFLVLESNPQDKGVLDKIFRLAHNLKGSSKAVGFDQMGAFTHEFESLMLKLKNGELNVKSSTINLMLRCNDFIRNMIGSLKDNLETQFDISELIAEIEQHKSGHDNDESTGQEAQELNSDVSSDLTQNSDVLVDGEFQTLDAIPSGNSFIEETKMENDKSATDATTNEVSVDLKVNEIVSNHEDSTSTKSEYPGFRQDLENAIEAAQKMSYTPKTFAEIDAIADEIMKTNQQDSQENVIELKTTANNTLVDKIILKESTSNIQKNTPSNSESINSTAHNNKDVSVKEKSTSNTTPEKQVDESIRVSLARLEKLQNYVGEMVILQSVLREQISDTTSPIIRKTAHQLGKVVKEIQDISMNLRMVPVKPTFQKMQRIVRDTAYALKKDVVIKLSGEETELDKTVLEKINDPLVHLIRNSVDHGIEPADIRVAKGKKAQGEVQLNAYHQSGKLVLEVKDDGGGLDGEKLRQVAIKKGILKPTQQLTEVECWNLIFAPGFSTKEQVTDVSGRGVGMDVVKTNIHELQGEIQIHSVKDVGTTFKVILPLTLAIIDGMVVQCGNDRYIMPLSHVHESVKPEKNQIQYSTGLGEVLLLRGENLPIFRLNNLIGKKSNLKTEELIAIVVRSGDEPFAVFVDDIIGQYQVVIKQLGPELQGLKGFSGSTILGDGRPALIVEPMDLVKARGKVVPRQNETGRAV